MSFQSDSDITIFSFILSVIMSHNECVFVIILNANMLIPDRGSVTFIMKTTLYGIH